MATYRIRLQEALLKKCKIVESTSSTTPKFSTLHFTFSILELVAYAAFAAGWLVAIATHL